MLMGLETVWVGFIQSRWYLLFPWHLWTVEREKKCPFAGLDLELDLQIRRLQPLEEEKKGIDRNDKQRKVLKATKQLN